LKFFDEWNKNPIIKKHNAVGYPTGTQSWLSMNILPLMNILGEQPCMVQLPSIGLWKLPSRGSVIFIPIFNGYRFLICNDICGMRGNSFKKISNVLPGKF